MISLSTVVWKSEPSASSVLAKRAGVGQVPVVGDGDLAPRAVGRQRLRIPKMGRPHGRVAGVAHGHVPRQIAQRATGEDLRHQSHATVDPELAFVARDDAGALLPAVLQGIKAVIRQLGGVRMAVNAEHAAVVFWVLLHRSRPVIARAA